MRTLRRGDVDPAVGGDEGVDPGDVFGQAFRQEIVVFHNMIACGTAAYAGLASRYAIEHWTRIPVEVDLAAFVAGDKLFEVHRKRSPWDTYAVIAVQRRTANQVWVVVAGLTGPATLGAAKIVHKITDDLIVSSTTGRSATVWAAVRVRVEETKNPPAYRSDERRIVSYEIESARYPLHDDSSR